MKKKQLSLVVTNKKTFFGLLKKKIIKNKR